MNEFEVYKDVSLIPYKVIFRYWHTECHQKLEPNQSNKEEAVARDALVSLLQENADSDIEIPALGQKCPHPSNLQIKLVKMPPLYTVNINGYIFS